MFIHRSLCLVTIGNRCDFSPREAVAALAALWCHPGAQNNRNENNRNEFYRPCYPVSNLKDLFFKKKQKV